MQNWSFLYKEHVEFFLAGVFPKISHRFWMMLSLGQYGIFSNDLEKLFSSLGLIHVLVLSGSQIQAYGRVLSYFYRFLGNQIFYNIFVSAAYLLVGGASSWTPPLTRAILGALCLLWFPRLHFRFLCFSVFIVQGLIFPGHFKNLGFYLSWFCWLLLIWAERYISSKTFKWIFLSLSCQTLVLVLLQKSLPSPGLMALWVIAGILAVYLFEGVIFGVVGWVYLLAYFCFLGNLLAGGILSVPFCSTLQSVFQEILGRLALGILVALRGFRYTFEYDL